MIFKLEVNAGNETLRLLVEVPARPRGERTSPPPLSEWPELTGTEATLRRGCLCRPCYRFSLPFGSCRGPSAQGPGRGGPSPVCRHRCLPRSRPDGGMAPQGWLPGASEPPVLPWRQHRLHAQARGQDARPLGCRRSRR